MGWRHSTATVLFHTAMAARLGLGPSDHKCLYLMVQPEDMTGSVRQEPVPERIAEVAAHFTRHGPSLDDQVAGMDADQIGAATGSLARADSGHRTDADRR